MNCKDCKYNFSFNNKCLHPIAKKEAGNDLFTFLNGLKECKYFEQKKGN